MNKLKVIGKVEGNVRGNRAEYIGRFCDACNSVHYLHMSKWYITEDFCICEHALKEIERMDNILELVCMKIKEECKIDVIRPKGAKDNSQGFFVKLTHTESGICTTGYDKKSQKEAHKIAHAEMEWNLSIWLHEELRE